MLLLWANSSSRQLKKWLDLRRQGARAVLDETVTLPLLLLGLYTRPPVELPQDRSNKPTNDHHQPSSPGASHPASTPLTLVCTELGFWRAQEDNLWLIDGKYHDLSAFQHQHPGGAEMMRLAREEYDDMTCVVEAHHTDWSRVRNVLKQYEVTDLKPVSQVLDFVHVDDKGGHSYHYLPAEQFCDQGSFYCKLRSRVRQYLTVTKQNPLGRPTTESIAAWYVSWISSLLGLVMVAWTGRCAVALVAGIPAGVAFGLGHNFVHQPREFWRAWSMELMGVSRDAWHCRHNLQHHMYTNTEKDNHFAGAPPVFTPNMEWGLHRVLHRWIYGSILPIFAFLFLVPELPLTGLWFSGCVQWHHLARIARDYNTNLEQQEQLRVEVAGRADDSSTRRKPRMKEPASFLWRMILPLEAVVLVLLHGCWWGLVLFMLMCGVCGVWFFVLGIANHYDGTIWTDSQYMAMLDPQDFASRQFKTTCDIGPGGESFIGSLKYLFFNYHLVHHLFPNIDASHHPEIDRIVDEVATECGIAQEHRRGDLWSLYWNMVTNLCAPKCKV